MAQLGTSFHSKNDQRRVKKCCKIGWKLRSFEHSQRIGCGEAPAPSAQRSAQLLPQLLLCPRQRSVQGRAILAAGLGQIGAAAAAAAAGLGNRADEGARLGAGGDHRRSEGRHQQHLAGISRIGQAAQHHRGTLAELIHQALGSPLQAGSLHPIKALHQQGKGFAGAG